MTVCQVRFDHMHKVVEERQHEAETEGRQMLEILETAKGLDASRLSDSIESHVEAVAETWDGLADELLLRFSDNTDIMASRPTWRAGVGSDSVIKSYGYPGEWLQGVGFE